MTATVHGESGGRYGSITREGRRCHLPSPAPIALWTHVVTRTCRPRSSPAPSPSPRRCAILSPGSPSEAPGYPRGRPSRLRDPVRSRRGFAPRTGCSWRTVYPRPLPLVRARPGRYKARTSVETPAATASRRTRSVEGTGGRAGNSACRYLGETKGGGHCWTRTSDLLLVRQTLSPTELSAQPNEGKHAISLTPTGPSDDAEGRPGSGRSTR